MINLTKGMIVAAAAVACLAFGTIAGAQEKQEKKTTAAAKPKSACNAMTEEKACRGDSTCIWIAALVDAKTGKQTRKAYCKTKSVQKAKEPAKTKEPKKS